MANDKYINVSWGTDNTDMVPVRETFEKYKGCFVISLTETNGSYTADKTFEEIKEAYDNRLPLRVRIGNSELPLMNAEFSGNDAGFSFGYTTVGYNGELVSTRSVNYLHTANQDEWTDADNSNQYLKTEGGDVIGDINMNQHYITNAGKLNAGNVFIGATIESLGTAGIRLTNTDTNEAAFVKADTQSNFVPVNIGTPTANSHAVTKKYVDDIFSYDATTKTLNITIEE